jgi:hypothetical protein
MVAIALLSGAGRRGAPDQRYGAVCRRCSCILAGELVARSGEVRRPGVKETIDFLVIGAQKSGTTSLFRYIHRHPSLYLPAQKETHFFSNESRFSKGLRWQIETYFSDADENKLWGEVCPSYLGYGAAPERIHAACPDVKLVAILRNPIDRAYSHYRMAVRRETEDRPFRQVVEELYRSRAQRPESKRGRSSDLPYMLEFSRYGKALERYLRYFGREQFLILFQEDLAARPDEVLLQLFSFLEVDTGYRPPNLDREYHVGGEKRLPWLDEWVRRRRLLKAAAKRALGSKKRVEAARFWFKQLNIKPVKDAGPTPEDRVFLRQIFEEDVALLRNLFSVEPPWPEFQEQRSVVSKG